MVKKRNRKVKGKKKKNGPRQSKSGFSEGMSFGEGPKKTGQVFLMGEVG